MGAIYTGAFELRRLLIEWSRGPSGGTQEDRAIITVDIAKIVAGAPSSGWTTPDYAAAEARVDTWWASVKTYYPPFMALQELRWYKNGPTWDPIGPAPPNPADRVTARSVAGTGALGSNVFPPQLALTITEVVDVRKRWGRMYLPAPIITHATTGIIPDGNGRLSPAPLAALLGFTVALYNGWRTDGNKPVVWSKAAAAYTGRRGSAIPAHDATAYEVTGLQMDNLFDVMRSRRFDGPTAKTLTALT